jgi:hypothetical protein
MFEVAMQKWNLLLIGSLFCFLSFNYVLDVQANQATSSARSKRLEVVLNPSGDITVLPNTQDNSSSFFDSQNTPVVLAMSSSDDSRTNAVIHPVQRAHVSVNESGKVTEVLYEAADDNDTYLKSDNPTWEAPRNSMVRKGILESKTLEDVEFKMTLLSGYRKDDLNWTIAGDINGQNPDILSELTWSNLDIFQFKANPRVILKDRFVLDGWLAYGEIFDGENQDSDYLGNGRTLEFSRSNNSANEGKTVDYSAAFGYRFDFRGLFGNESMKTKFLEETDVDFTLFAGYSRHELDTTMKDGFQTIPALGPFADLHSQYDARWSGPWLGLEVEGRKNRLNGLVRFEYHFNTDYYGVGNWNLRDDFQHPKSFEHDTEGDGIVFNCGLDYALTQSLDLNLRADVQDWKGDAGIDRTFFSNGVVSETRFNEVNWESYAVMVGATARFF